MWSGGLVEEHGLLVWYGRLLEERGLNRLSAGDKWRCLKVCWKGKWSDLFSR